jgi:RHS repeat-associated protein
MARSIRFLVAGALTILGPALVHGQVQTGTPPFGSFAGGPDVINLGSLNAHIDVSVMNKPGRGLNFTYDLTYDSSVWYPVTTGSVTTWTPALNYGWQAQTAGATGFISYTQSSQICNGSNGINAHTWFATNFVYHDQFGSSHPFPGTAETTFPTSGATGCPNLEQSVQQPASDSSGYTITVTKAGTPGTWNASLVNAVGRNLAVPSNANSGAATVKDRNGNELTIDNSGNFYDTLSSTTPVLAVTGSGTAASPTVLTYKTSTGASAQYTVNYTNYTVATNFGISGISDVKSLAAVPLVSNIVLPDGSQYSFTYEATPATPTTGACTPYAGTTCVTARLKSFTLPTGATITYAYTGGNNGVLTDGSTSGLTRTTPDGSWTYARTSGTGAASATLITAPILSYDTAANQTIAQFQGIYPTQTNVYQGAAPTFTLPISEATLQTAGLLQETQICYNASASPCPTLAVSLPITQRAVRSRLAGSGALWTQHTEKFNAFGMQTEIDDYDFAATPPGTRLQQTTITYASLGGSLSAFPQTVEFVNAAGTVQSRQDTAYDGVTPHCITGAPQHDDTNFSCTFNSRGNATSVTNYTDPVTPSGSIVKNFTYDSLGNLLTAQLNCCQQKTWVYSTATDYAYPDSVTSGSSAPQLTTTMTYDLNTGLTLTSTDPNNLKTTNTYEPMGRPLTTVVGTNPAITYTYADFNNSSTFTPWTVNICSPVQGTATACQKTIEDSQGRTATSQLLDASSTLYSASDTQYDAWGRAFKVSNPYTASAAYWTQTNTDAVGRTTKTTLQDSSVSTSSYTDNTVTATDPAGEQRRGVSDSLGRLTSVYEPDPTNGNSLTLQTSYVYNVFNQLTQVTQGSQTRAYVYDALARLRSSTTPEAGTVCLGTYSGSTCQANGYDNFNNILYRTDARGVVTNYLYDTLNRLVGIAYPTLTTGVSPMPNVCKANGATSNNANVCFGYGTTPANFNNGLPVNMADASGSETYAYNSLEQLIQLQKVIGGTTYISNYAYNLSNELDQITYPSGRIVAQSYDAIGRLCAVGASGSSCTAGTFYANSFTYSAAQQATGFNYGNGVAASFGYSSDRLQLTSVAYAKSGTTLFGLSYSYGTSDSNDGLISGVTDNVQSGRNISYTYDSLARLSTALTSGSSTYPQWGLKWTYDRYANRTQQAVTAGTSAPSNLVTVSSTTNQITGSPYAYDVSGNLLNDGLNTLAYDGENRATSATNGSTSGVYSYDGGGLRVKKVAGATTTVYIFSGSKVVAEYDNGAAPSAPSREYIYSGVTLLAKIDSTGTKYYHRDALSNRFVTDSTGSFSAEMGHYPYGESWYNASNDKFLFTSYEQDAETSNDYALARTYLSRLGRYSATDALAADSADPQAFNQYSYVRNNPISFVDPTGRLMINDPFLCLALNNFCGLTQAPSDPPPTSQALAGGAGGTITKPRYRINLKVLNDCLARLNIHVTITAFEVSTPGGSGSATGTGVDLFSGHNVLAPITVTNDAFTYNADGIRQLCNGAATELVVGCTTANPYLNYTNNNNTPFGTLTTQVHELGHSLFKITSGSNFIPEPNGDIGKALEDCVKTNHGISKVGQ